MKTIDGIAYPDTIDGILADPELLPVFRAHAATELNARPLDFLLHPYDPKTIYLKYIDPNGADPVNIQSSTISDAIALTDDFLNPTWADLIDTARGEVATLMSQDTLGRFWVKDTFKDYHAKRLGVAAPAFAKVTDDVAPPLPQPLIKLAQDLGLEDVEALGVYQAKLERFGLLNVVAEGEALLEGASAPVTVATLNTLLVDRGIVALQGNEAAIMSHPAFHPAVRALADADQGANAAHVVQIVHDLRGAGVVVTEDDVDRLTAPLARNMRATDAAMDETPEGLPVDFFRREFQKLVLDVYKVREATPMSGMATPEFTAAREALEMDAYNLLMLMQNSDAVDRDVYTVEEIMDVAYDMAQVQEARAQREAQDAGRPRLDHNKLQTYQEIMIASADGATDKAALVAKAAEIVTVSRGISTLEVAHDPGRILGEIEAQVAEIAAAEDAVTPDMVAAQRERRNAAQRDAPPEPPAFIASTDRDAAPLQIEPSMAIEAADAFEDAVAAFEAGEQEKLGRAVDAVVAEVRTQNELDVDFSDVMDVLRAQEPAPSEPSLDVYKEGFMRRGFQKRDAAAMARFVMAGLF